MRTGLAAPSPSDVFAKRLAQQRKASGLTAQQLSDRVSDLGGEVSRGTIAKLETGTRGSRGVTLDEAFQLSLALGVPLSLMVLPVLDDQDGDEVAAAPALVAPCWRLWEWLHGQERLDGPEWLTSGIGSHPALLYSQLRDAHKAAQRAVRELRFAADDEDRHKQWDAYYAVALRALIDALSEMEEAGLRTDGLLHSTFAREAKKRGIEKQSLMERIERERYSQDDRYQPRGERK